MPLEALGYRVRFGCARRLAAIRHGIDRPAGGGTGPSLLAFRMDDRKQRIVVDRAMAEGERFFGWEVADAGALDALAAQLERARVEVTAEPQTLAENRRVRGLISFRDPAGNRLEAFHGAAIDDDSVSPRPLDFRLPHRSTRPWARRADG